MTVARTVFGSTATITITLASLASDANLSTGRASNGVDVTGISTIPIDIQVGGIIGLTSLSTTIVGGRIEIWTGGLIDGSTALSGNLSTADAAQSMNFQKNTMRLLASLAVTTTPIAPAASTTVAWGPCSVAQSFGGILPPLFSLFVTHNLSAALNAQSSLFNTQYVALNFASS